MPIYEYKAFASGGKTKSGIIDADTERDARSKLRKDDLLVTQLTETRGGKKLKRAKAGVKGPGFLARLSEKRKSGRGPGPRESEIIGGVTRQLATLIGSGIALNEALNAIVDQAENRQLETMFRQTELETRASLNMNVLDVNGVPGVMNLKQVLRAFLDHRFDVLLRHTAHRLAQIAHRLEVLGGYLVAYLNLDEVIRIIREEDEPRKVMMKRFKISEVQAEAILNMRLRALRKLEEIEIRSEFDALKKEQTELKKLQDSKDRQKTVLSKEIAEMVKRFGPETELGRRRTKIGKPPEPLEVPAEALVEREPITVLCSAKGWIRATKGHLEEDAPVKYKDGDRERFRFHAETTDKLVLFATNGRFFTLPCDKLPGGRGLGEPLGDEGRQHVVQHRLPYTGRIL